MLLQNMISSKAVFNFVILLVLFWILARPLKGIGESIYFSAGSLANNSFQTIIKSKSGVNELLKAKQLLFEQDKTIIKLNLEINKLEDETNENKRLKSVLELKRRFNNHTIPAEVIGRTADNWHKQLILNKGKEENLMIGDSVISEKGVVGQIVEVNKNSAIVQLISDPSFKIGCKIADKNFYGILSGKTNSISLLEFLPVGTKVKRGDKVITSGISASGLSPTYPPGYPIGRINKVSKVRNKASDLYIEVKLSEDLTSLSKVLVFSPG